MIRPQSEGQQFTFKIVSQTSSGHFDFQIDDAMGNGGISSAIWDSVTVNQSTVGLCTLKTVNSLINLSLDDDSNGVADRSIPPDTLLVGSHEMAINSGWNLISLPVDVNPAIVTNLFPFAVSSAFKFQNTYFPTDTLQQGIGYWLKFPEIDLLHIAGNYITLDTFFVSVGWNMIGSISEAVAVSSITSIPASLIASDFYEYSGSTYLTVDTIRSGNGYWVKINQDGKLILSSTPSINNAARIKIQPTSDLPPSPPIERGEVIALPKEYALIQAYPNPFNPTTTIKYHLPLDSRVTLEVYNLVGQVVATLAHEVQSAGYKSLKWNASSLSSGVYLYRLDAVSVTNPDRSFSQGMKLVLIR
jgi:hypothetical protein